MKFYVKGLAFYIVALCSLLLNLSCEFNKISSEAENKKKIQLDTSSSGANVSENISNFPVLIRINSNNNYDWNDFDFSKIGSSSNNFQFKDSNGNILSYEIEAYDEARGNVNFWVMVPEIKGNSSENFIVFEYGEGISSTPSTKTVFHSSDSFAAVYHMDSYSDASDNGNDGEATAGSPDQVDGMIGNAYSFDGSDKKIEISDSSSLEPSVVTVSAWVKLDGTQSPWAAVGCKGADVTPYCSYSLELASFSDSICNVDSSTNCFGGSSARMDSTQVYPYNQSTAEDLVWYHIAVVIDPSKGEQRFYVNGEASSVLTGTGDETSTSEINYYTSTDYPLVIGSQNDKVAKKLSGSIDEFRVESAARSASWVKLNYENQKEKQSLVKY